METIKAGTKVEYRPAWGSQPPKVATIKRIEKCSRIGEKYGNEVKEISWNNKDYGVYELDDGHWCYGYQIDKIVKKHKVILEHTKQREPLEKGWNLVNLKMVLSDDELEYLKHCMSKFSDCDTLALHEFTHGILCSKYHKHKIWKTFESGDINITIVN